MAKTSRDARKHIKALSDIFMGMTEIGEDVIDELIKQYSERKYLRQSMKRLIDKGFLKQKEKKWIVTKEGRRFFLKKFPEEDGKTIKNSTRRRWDGKWRLVSFDVPGGYSAKRDQIRSFLKEFDFLPLQKSVWVSPNSSDDEFWKLLVKNNLDRYCKIMIVDILEGDEELRRRFRLTKTS